MEFEYTWKLLHLLWIVPLFGLLVYFASSRRKQVLKMIFGSNADASSNSSLSQGRRYLRLWLLIAAIIFIVVAIARPRWGWRILPFSGKGRDLMIVLDVSKSMNSEDVRPTRLKHSKLFLRDLIKDNPGDRFGLVAFAGSAFLECPLTVDKTSIFQALEEINTDTIPLGGTNIENALNTALQAFKAAEGGYRAIILITDGDELYGDSSRTIAELKRLKIPVFVVGIGDPTGDGLIKMTGPDGKTKLMRDAQGNLIKSKLNETQLRKLAASTGNVSIYVRSTETEPELAAVNTKIRQLVPKEYTKGSNKRPIERFHYPLFAAVLLLLIRFGIGERKKINPALLLVCFLMLTGLTPFANAQTKTGKNEPEKKLELAEEENKTESEEKDDTDKLTPVDVYNKALKRHNEKNHKEAEKLYKQAINMAEVAPEVRSKAFQNLGVISHEKSRTVMEQDPDKALKILDQAEEMYKESMRSNTKRKKVVLNQQKLLDDREIAKQIKKQKEELKNKQKQAQKKTKEAHDQQKKENQDQPENKDQQDKKDQNKNQQNNQKQQQNQQENKNQESKDQKNNKDNQDKKQQQGRDDKQDPKDMKGGSGSGKKDQNNAQGNTDQKIRDAQKACKELEKAAQKNKRQDLKKQAEEAAKELDNAKNERNKGNGEKAEEHLKKAMEKLKPSGEDKKDKDNQQQDKNNQKNQDQKDKNDDKMKDQDKKLEQNKPENPQQDSKEPESSQEEKEIDPAQAAALLDLMANDEKTLRDKIKENQKRDARVKKVLKDW